MLQIKLFELFKTIHVCEDFSLSILRRCIYLAKYGTAFTLKKHEQDCFDKFLEN